MKALERRIEALEERRAENRRNRQPVKSLSTLKAALLILATMREGEEAEKEVAAANDPKRRAELTKTIEVARGIAATLAKCRPAKEVEQTNEVSPWLHKYSDPARCSGVAPIS